MKPHWKALVLIVAIAGIGIYAYQTFKSTKNSTSPTTQSTASEKTFVSQLINLSFRYPSTMDFTEEDFSKDSPDSTGKSVLFKDNTAAENTSAFGFEAVTTDFKEIDTVPQDLLPEETILNSSTNFASSNVLGPYAQSRSVAPGMYLVASYFGGEGNASFPITLFVEPPRGSGLKYISFSLGDGTKQRESCSQRPSYG